MGHLSLFFPLQLKTWGGKGERGAVLQCLQLCSLLSVGSALPLDC